MMFQVLFVVCGILLAGVFWLTWHLDRKQKMLTGAERFLLNYVMPFVLIALCVVSLSWAVHNIRAIPVSALDISPNSGRIQT